MYEYDRRIALVAMQDVAKLLAWATNHGIRLNVANVRRAAVVARFCLASEAATRQDWTTQHANFFRSDEITKRILFIMLSAVGPVAAFKHCVHPW